MGGWSVPVMLPGVANVTGKPPGLMDHMVKNLPAMWETWVRSLGWEDTLEKGMATHPSILAWRILQTEVTVHEVSESDTTE